MTGRKVLERILEFEYAIINQPKTAHRNYEMHMFNLPPLTKP